MLAAAPCKPANGRKPCTGVFTAASMRAWAPLLAILPLASGSELVSQRIWIQTWTVGATCSDNTECRSAAAKFLTNGTAPTAPWPLPAYQPKEVAIFAPVSFTDGSGAPVDLTDMHQLKGENFSQVNGVCASDAASLALHPQFPVKAHGGGCLSSKGSPPHAFLAALVQPLPATPTQHWGGTVRGCPHGLCIVNVNVPPAGVSHATSAIVERTVVQVWCVTIIIREHSCVVLLEHGHRPDLTSLRWIWAAALRAVAQPI
jgi:hypothetical protein